MLTPPPGQDASPSQDKAPSPRILTVHQYLSRVDAKLTDAFSVE